MGGDGGTISTQRKFVRGQEERKSETKDIKYEQMERSRTCAQSSLPLIEPIVACELGNLYTKESLLTAILSKSLNKSSSHIRGMKDFRLLKLQSNNAAISTVVGEDSVKYMCPITQLPFNGTFPFVFIWSTGYVLSEKALTEVGVSSLQEEYGPFTSDDVIKLLPIENVLAMQMIAMETRRGGEKKEKKVKRKPDADEVDKKRTKSGTHREVSIESASVLAKTALAAAHSTMAESATFSSLFHNVAADKHQSAAHLFMGAERAGLLG